MTVGKDTAMMRKTNYHTHTTRCKHATDTEVQYIEAALEGGFSVLGFSDHTPWPYEKTVNRMRMDPEELDGYIACIRGLAERYADRIEISVGLECEYFPDYMRWLDYIAGEKGIDYLILGNHFDRTDHGGRYFGDPMNKKDLIDYGERTAEGIRTGLFACVAHPDLPMRKRESFGSAEERMADLLCSAALEMNIPLEYNLAGLFYTAHPERYGVTGLGYPCEDFWRYAAQRGCKAIIGCDSHWSAHVRTCGLEEYEPAAAFLESIGMQRVDTLTMRKK